MNGACDVRGRRSTAALVLGGSVLLALSGGLLRVGLPSVRHDLGAGIAAMQAVGMAGLVVATSTVMAFGHLADLMEPRSVYAAGPGLGGIIVQEAGWRAGLALLVPPALILAALMTRARAAPHRHARREPFDLAGAAALGGFLSGLVLLIGARIEGIWQPVVVALVLACSTAFVRAELRARRPLLDLRLFAVRGFSAGLAAVFLNFLAMASNMFLMPFFLQDLLGHGPAGRAW